MFGSSDGSERGGSGRSPVEPSRDGTETSVEEQIWSRGSWVECTLWSGSVMGS